MYLMISLLSLILCATLVWRRRLQIRPAPKRQPAKTREDYRCVAVASEADCCQAARALRGKRFLGKEAPILPLRACTLKTCSCYYRHYPDRRSGDRRNPLRAQIHLLPHQDRRTMADRRRRKDDVPISLESYLDRD